MSIEIPRTLTVQYSVDKCVFPSFNGTHTEVFDLSRLSSDDFTQYLAQTLIIKRQSQCRSKTASEKVKLGTYVVPAPGKRIEITEAGIQKRIKDAKNVVHLLTEDEKRQLAKEMGFAYIPVGLPKPEDADLEEGETSTIEVLATDEQRLRMANELGYATIEEAIAAGHEDDINYATVPDIEDEV
jgi:hypothetical protein